MPFVNFAPAEWLQRLDLEKHAELHRRLGILIHRTLLSLICCYDTDSYYFHTAVDTLPDEAHPTFQGKPNAGDTATLLLAIDGARDSMRRQSRQDGSAPDFWAAFWKSVDKFYVKEKIEPISYESYRTNIFERSLDKIANATGITIDEILKPKGESDRPRSPFRAARILSLMNKFPQ